MQTSSIWPPSFKTAETLNMRHIAVKVWMVPTQADGTEYIVPAEAVKQPEQHFSAASNAKAPRYCQHGTQGRWLEGCRCTCCVSAHRAALRAARLAKEQAK